MEGGAGGGAAGGMAGRQVLGTVGTRKGKLAKPSNSDLRAGAVRSGTARTVKTVKMTIKTVKRHMPV